MLLTATLVSELRAAAARGDTTLEVSPDLGRSRCIVGVQAEAYERDGVVVALPERVRERTIYYRAGDTWQVASRFGQALYKLVPTDWGPPVFEIDGIKMLVSQSVSPLEDARRKVSLVRVGGAEVLDTCAGLGYFAVAALEQGVGRMHSYEKSDEVRWLRTLNPWSPPADARLTLTAGNVLDHLPTLGSGSVEVILHDPPRFGIAGELYSQQVYAEFARLLRPGGRLLHYVGSPNRLTSGRDVPAEVMQRLKRAGFGSIRAEGDSVLADKPRGGRR